DALGTATSGQLSSYYQDRGYQYPIYVQVPEAMRKTVPDLLNLPITPSRRSADGGTTKPILLGQVAKQIYALGPSELTRINRRRYVAINARIQDRSESEVTAEVEKTLNKMEFGGGISWSFGTNQQR